MPDPAITGSVRNPRCNRRVYVDLAGRQHHADLSAARHELETLKVQHEEQLRKERNSLQQPARDSTADRTQPISPARTTQTYQTDGMSVMSRMPREMPYLVELVLPPGLSWRSVGKPLFNKWTQASGGDSAQVKYVWKVAGKKKVQTFNYFIFLFVVERFRHEYLSISFNLVVFVES